MLGHLSGGGLYRGAMADLHDRSILVLGATGGLGRELVALLAERGARLTLTARDASALAALAPEGAATVAADLLDESAPRTVVATALTAHGALDGVINAAGAVAFGPVAETADETLDALWRLHVAAPLSLLRAATPALAESAAEGRAPFVLSLSGAAAETPTAGLGVYSAVKAAQSAAHQVAARELRRAGIRIVDARPGHTETQLSHHPLAGERPALPTGYAPSAVAARLIAAIIDDERDLPASAFSDLPRAGG